MRNHNNNNNSSNAKGKRDGGFNNNNNNTNKPTTIATTNAASSATGGGGDYRKPVHFEIQPKKNLETNWRSRDAADKTTPESAGPAATPVPSLQPKSAPQIDDTAIAATYHQKKPALLPLTTPKQQQQAIPIEKLPPALRPIVGNAQNMTSPTVVRQPQEAVAPPALAKEAAQPLMVEQRGNIQFSVSRDGEIQSVKCKDFVFFTICRSLRLIIIFS